MTSKLYIEININSDKEIFITTESFVTLYVYLFSDSPESIDLCFIEQENSTSDFNLKLNAKQFKYRKVKLIQDNHEVSDLKLPVFVKDCTSVAGLCAVCREIIREYRGAKGKRELLGFKDACLLSPAECSVWTKFCEIDLIDGVDFVNRINFDDITKKSCKSVVVPFAFSRFESHMSQPVRVHNIYKLAREKANETVESAEEEKFLMSPGAKAKPKKTKNRVFIGSNIPIEELNLDHQYAEGCSITLADVILYSCYSLCFAKMPDNEELKKLLPLTFRWFDSVTTNDADYKATFDSILSRNDTNDVSLNETTISYEKEDAENCSLYKSDPKRYKPRDRIYTRQDCVEESLEQFSLLNISASSETSKHFNETALDCDPVLFRSYPHVGDLPEKRLIRKKQQLENLANAVISIANDNDRIVDFCCGSGHLGIILATMLPKCQIIFLENKAISLKRARDRAENLNLTNCSFYQSNLDYFTGTFNIGSSLHACGTATDIVIWQCIRKSANFVCCPCCYGSVTPMPHISYPRSRKFNTIMDQKNYLYIAHAADQAHNAAKTECNVEKSVQGQLCMDIIDTDRKLMAEEAGYQVVLTRLQPEDCTPKNRLLLGVI